MDILPSCKMKRLPLGLTHGREQIGGKQKILIKNPHDDADFFLIIRKQGKKSRFFPLLIYRIGRILL
ncbi:MAG: hypothetical protein IJN80_05135, partial [Clostridia bacterium]|nr:hypothetical protein [Clostridia bacterium]